MLPASPERVSSCWPVCARISIIWDHFPYSVTSDCRAGGLLLSPSARQPVRALYEGLPHTLLAALLQRGSWSPGSYSYCSGSSAQRILPKQGPVVTLWILWREWPYKALWMVLRLIFMSLLLSQTSDNYSLVHAFCGRRAPRLTRPNPTVTCFDPAREAGGSYVTRRALTCMAWSKLDLLSSSQRAVGPQKLWEVYLELHGYDSLVSSAVERWFTICCWPCLFLWGD